MKIFQFLMTFLKGQISFLSNFVSVFRAIKHNSSVLFQLKHYILWSKAASILSSSFIVITHKSPVNFKLKYFQLWTKESDQSPNLETFKCSGENLLNSSFPNHQLVFLQIFYHSLVKNYQKEPIKEQTIETFE